MNAPCFEGLSSVEIEILMAKYIYSMEEISSNKEYMQEESGRKQEMDSFLDILDELLKIYCKYNFENPEQEKSHYEDDVEEWEL